MSTPHEFDPEEFGLMLARALGRERRAFIDAKEFEMLMAIAASESSVLSGREPRAGPPPSWFWEDAMAILFREDEDGPPPGRDEP